MATSFTYFRQSQLLAIELLLVYLDSCHVEPPGALLTEYLTCLEGPGLELCCLLIIADGLVVYLSI